MMTTLLSWAGSHYVNQSSVTTKWYYDNFRFQRSLYDPLYLPGCYQIRRSPKTWTYRAVERISRHMDTMDGGRSPAPSISASCLPIVKSLHSSQRWYVRIVNMVISVQSTVEDHRIYSCKFHLEKPAHPIYPVLPVAITRRKDLYSKTFLFLKLGFIMAKQAIWNQQLYY